MGFCASEVFLLDLDVDCVHEDHRVTDKSGRIYEMVAYFTASKKGHLNKI